MEIRCEVCQSLVLQPDPLLEQEFAKEALERHVNGKLGMLQHFSDIVPVKTK